MTAYMKLITWLARARCLEVIDFKPDTYNTIKIDFRKQQLKLHRRLENITQGKKIKLQSKKGELNG